MKTVIPSGAKLVIIGLCLLAFGLEVAPAQTTNSCVSPLNSDFFSKFEVLETVSYVETNSAGPVLAESNSFEFAAVIKLSTSLSGTVSVAILTVPGQNNPVLMQPVGTSEFGVGIVTNSYSNVTSAFPDGTYQFTFSNTTISVALPEATTLPNAPTLSNYAADQSIDSTKDFTLTWNPFVTGGVLDFISVSLTEEALGSNVFSSDAFGCPGALDGESTSILIPAHTLASNTTYTAKIEFVKAYTFDTNSIRGDALLAGTEADTTAIIATGPGVVQAAPPVLANAASLPGGGLRFDYSATAGLAYTIQFNPDLGNPTGWSTLLTTIAVANSASYTNSPPFGSAAGYYRVVQQ